MNDKELLQKYIYTRDKAQEKYLKLSRENANILLGLKNLINAESVNLDLLAVQVEKWLDNRYQILCCRDAVMRMNENIYISSAVGFNV